MRGGKSDHFVSRLFKCVALCCAGKEFGHTGWKMVVKLRYGLLLQMNRVEIRQISIIDPYFPAR